MQKYTVIADPIVKDDLKEAKEFLNSKRKGYGKKFIIEYRTILKTLQKNPHFQIRYQEVHCLPFKNFKYMVHFKVDESKNEVHIYGHYPKKCVSYNNGSCPKSLSLSS